jgi:hypothetical protein
MEMATVETEPAASVVEAAQGAAPELGTTAAPEVRVAMRVNPLPMASTDVVVRELEIEETALIRAAPTAGATSTSHRGLELLDDNLVDPAIVARNMESMHRSKQWIKVCCGYHE